MGIKKSELKLKTAKLDAERAARRQVLEPAVLGVVSALGGYEDVLIKSHSSDEVEFVDENGKKINTEKDPRTERVYKLGDECLGCLKDLKKFWRLDEEDENRTVARILYASQILPNDLLPILLSLQTQDKKNYRVALLVSDLIAALTWPIDIASELKEAFEIEDEESRRQATNIDYSSLIDAQLSYKRHIVRHGVCGHIFNLILPAIQKNKNERTEKDENVISLILHTIRNLLAIRDKASSTQQSSVIQDSYLQSDLILQLSECGAFDLLIHMSHESGRFDQYGQWNMIVLDIWHMIFRGIDSEDLIDSEACAGTTNVGEPISNVKPTDKKLENLLLDEERARKFKARHSSTRHSRFGTTLTVTAGEKRFTLHSQTAITTPVENALDARKQSKKKSVRLANEFGRSTQLRLDALKVLRSVVIEFIESGFNPFFMSVLGDLKMRSDDTDFIRFYSLLGFFLKCFLKLKEREKSAGILPTSEAGHDFDLVADLIAPECLMWVVMRIQAGLDEKPISAVEVHAAVDCVIQQLLVIEGLSESGVEQYSQAANAILNKLYYDSQTLDMVVDLMSTYTNQSLKYLENIVHFSFVFLKSLERYSKSTHYMYVRKKKPARKSKLKNLVDGNVEDQAETGVNPIDDEEQAYLDGEQNDTRMSEHKFEFGAFQFRFATTAVVDTLMIYLQGYHGFSDPELMKRVVKLMHRQVVGAEAHRLYFRAPVLNTFDSIIQDKAFMPKHPNYTDLMRLIEYILKQFFKSLDERPVLVAETLYMLSKKEWNDAFHSVDDSDRIPAERRPARKVPKLPAEIVIQPGLTWSQRLGVAVGVLVDKGESDLIEKVKDVLRLASASRAAIVLMNNEVGHDVGPVDIQAWIEHSQEEISEELKAQLDNPSQSILEKFEDYKVRAEDGAKDFEEALGRDPQLHTLLRLLHWESEEENPGFLAWTIPRTRTHCQIDVEIKVIDYFLINPLDINGKPAAEFTKRKRTKRKTKRSELTAEELALDNSSENETRSEPTKGKQMTKKRRSKRSDLTAEELALDESNEDSDDGVAKAKKASRKSKKLGQARKYLSAEFVADSDDEENEERDRLFFERERQLRAQMDQAAILQISKPLRPKKIGKKALAAEQKSEPAAPKPHGASGEERDPLSPSSASNSQVGRDQIPRIATSPPLSSTSSDKSPLPTRSGGLARRKRDVEAMVDEPHEGQDQDENDSDVVRKAAKSRKLFIDDSDDE